MPLDVPGGALVERFTTMQTSRGCPWPCVFCDIPIFNEGKWRSRSPGSRHRRVQAVAEGRLWRRLFRRRPLPAAAQAHRGNLRRAWRGTSITHRVGLRGARRLQRAWNSSRRMAKAHCRTLMFGIETGSQKILDRLKKEQTLEEVETAVNAAQTGRASRSCTASSSSGRPGRNRRGQR